MLKIEKTKLDGVLLIEPPSRFEDFRGEYVETYNEPLYHEAGITTHFVQDDISISRRHVLRGLHGDETTWKLVSCMSGALYLVVVDWRADSPTRGAWLGFTLTAVNRRQVLIPPSFGNGHLVLTETAIFHYKQSTTYDGGTGQFTLHWDDPALNIHWPISNPMLSQRDSGWGNDEQQKSNRGASPDRVERWHALFPPTTHRFGALMSTSNKALQRVGTMYSQRSSGETDIDGSLRNHLTELLPHLGHSWNWDIQVTLKRQAFSRLIWFYELYKKIVDVQGSILEFGIQWGATLTTMHNCRSMFEPFNYARKIYGFDTFEGFTTVDEKDGGFSEKGMYSVSSGYQEILDDMLRLHEGMAPAPHIQKFDLIKGDASETFPKWLEENPHAVIAMAIFDMDVYKPTKDVLQAVLPRLTKGSLLVFDELNCDFFPGETQALHEVLGLGKLALHSVPYQPYASWAVWEG